MSIEPRTRKKRLFDMDELFSLFIPLYPVLCIYKAFLNFTIGDVILIFFFIRFFRTKIEADRRLYLVAIFALFSIFGLLFNLLFSGEATDYNTSQLVFRLIKYIFYMSSVFILHVHFRYEQFKKSIIIVSWISCIFLVYQYLAFYIFGRVVIGQLKWLPVYLESYTKIDYAYHYMYNFRPCSIFLEPAIFCQYIVVPLCLELFFEKQKKRYTSIIVYSFSMLLTTSAQGVLYLVLIYFTYYIINSKNKTKGILITIILAITAVICYENINPIRMAVDRLSSDDASNARFSSYHYCLSMNWFHSLLGHGYGVTANNEYMASFAYIWYGCGIIGLGITLWIFWEFYRGADNICARTICVLYLMMFFGASLYYNYMLFWYFIIILSLSSSEKTKEVSKDEYPLHIRSIQT